MTKFVAFFYLIIASSPALVLANDQGPIEQWFSRHVFKNELGQLYQDGHESIESHPGHFYDLKRLALAAVRWKNLNQDKPIVGEHVKNFFFMFSLSHTTEVLTIPLSVAYCLVEGGAMIFTGSANPSRCLGYLSASLVVATPGTDPLCWIVFAPYFLPKVNKVYRPAVTFVREWAMNHVSRFMFDEISRFKYITDKLSVMPVISETGEESAFIAIPLGSLFENNIELNLIRRLDGKSYLESAVLPYLHLSSDEIRLVAKNLKLLGFNSSEAILDIVKHSSQKLRINLDNQIHIAKMNSDESSVEVKFVPMSLVLNDVIKLKPLQVARSLAKLCSKIIK